MALAKQGSGRYTDRKVVRNQAKIDLDQLLNSSFENRKSHDKIIRRILTAIDSPRSLTVWLLYASKEHDQLVQLECNPLDYTVPEHFRADYTATELLSKSDFLELSTDKKVVAIEKFLMAEEQCRRTNRLLRNVEHGFVTGEIKNLKLASCLSDMAFKIESLLGDFGPDEFVDACAWGPGSTYFLPRKYANQYTKYLRERGATTVCRDFITPWFTIAYPLWARSGDANLSYTLTTGLLDVELAPGNKVITVSKNAKTDRVICVEPGLNLWFQKGIGMMMRRRLRRGGNSIDFQTRNQDLCRQALKKGLVTVDFSAASDTISLEVVRLLFPRKWFDLMCKFRSASGVLEDGTVLRWEKFSTMGNGFTFELETFIFYALALHCCGVVGVSTEDVSVFGDDVILPKAAFTLFKELSSHLGFTVNAKKSHVEGEFRESCGVHYFGQLDTKPLYIKSRPNRLPDVYKLANGIRSLSHRWNSDVGCDVRFIGPWIDAREWVPKNLRFFGPPHLGDTVLWANIDECTPLRSRRGLDAWSLRCLGEKKRRVRGRCEYAWLAERVRSIRGSEVAFVKSKEGDALVCTADTNDVPSSPSQKDRLGGAPIRGLITLGGKNRICVQQGILVHQWYDMGGWAA